MSLIFEINIKILMALMKHIDILQRIDRPDVSFCYKMSAEGDHDTGICAIEIFKNSQVFLHVFLFFFVVDKV